MSAAARRYRIDYALEPKKVKTFILPSLVDHAKQNGVDLVPVDPSKPLIEQGPFHCIIHKLYSRDWNEQLSELASKYPTTPIIDPPERIDKLHNRISMLEAVSRIKISQGTETVGVPRQVVIGLGEAPKELELGLKFQLPVIAKPLLADGGANSHDMWLILNSEGLEKLIEEKEPIVVQEFVKHGGVVFKVYVAGKHVQCVKRRSLPDNIICDSDPEDLISSDGRVSFSRISNSMEMETENAVSEMPRAGLVEEMAMALKHELGLRLFNFDVIRDCRESNYGEKYLVIDINYFPGYAKMPNYEHVFTDFLLDVVRTNQN